MNSDERDLTMIVPIIGDEIERRGAPVVLGNDRFVNWLARDLREGLSMMEQMADQRAADAFARRVRARTHAERALGTLVAHEATLRAPEIRATAVQSIQAAAFVRCAPLLELAAAAGSGRALWDEMCEAWLELPADVPASKHVAIRVAGESMIPVLYPRDIILVKLDALPADGDMVVARLDDDGYVVKRYERTQDGKVELSSFNAAFQPIVAERRRVAVLGTVIARFTTKNGTM